MKRVRTECRNAFSLYSLQAFLLARYLPFVRRVRTERRSRRDPRHAGRMAELTWVRHRGEKGHWRRTRRELIIGDAENSPETHRPSDRNLAEVPFQPWTRAMWDYNRVHSDRDAPHARCKPSAGPRQIGTAYGFEIVDLPELGRRLSSTSGGRILSALSTWMDGPIRRILRPPITGIPSDRGTGTRWSWTPLASTRDRGSTLKVAAHGSASPDRAFHT